MKIAVLLAEGFEEVEALTVVDYLRRLDLELDMISIYDELEVKGAHNISVRADRSLDGLNYLDYRALVIPGGLPGATNLRDDSRVVDFVQTLDREKALLAAICAGPIVLKEAGLTNNREITAYPGIEEELEGAIYRDENVVVDSNIITAKGPALAIEFALEIARYLLGQKAYDDLSQDILYPSLKGK